MTLFHLVRHGLAAVPPETLAGRTPGIPLQAPGRQQVLRLAPRLGRETIRALYTSPIERARETAEILARELGLTPQVLPALTEVDYGEWSGKHYDQIRQSPTWARFLAFRSGTRAPGGELMLEIQARTVSLMLNLREQAPADTLLVVTHGDVVRAAVLFFLGIPIDLMNRIDIDTASLTTIRLEADSAQVIRMNWTPDGS